MATKKNPSGTPRSRKKASTTDNPVATPETVTSHGAPQSAASTASTGGTAVATARQQSAPASTPRFNYPADLQDKIRRRAYELFQKRGGQHGFDVEDWLKAEAELGRR